MLELGPYLRDTGRLSPAIAVRSSAEVLSGGVSNVVMRVSVPDGEDFVVKQSRAQLRTQAAWFSQPERIWRERDVLDVLSRVTPGLVPKLLFEDRDNFLFAMEAIPREHLVWKTCLLDGEADPLIALRLGEALLTVHSQTVGDTDLNEQLGDRTIFDELRLDPFYRFVAEREPELSPALGRLIEETQVTQVCLVLGDFSPKNILLVPTETGIFDQGRPRLVLVDFETGHFGDPAFDVGFFLSHLLLKTIKHANRVDEYLELVRVFWSAYTDEFALGRMPTLPYASIERRTVCHLAACMKARVDGKSTVDYLTSEAQALVRELTREWLLSPPDSLVALLTNLRRRLKAACSC
ncbi:MAG: Uncharacterized protein FD138_2257 [Planctomycetota bacterium]|nr:MAG: Uncharacterized protein FD138_2257 [Planctomycetota bacterium]